MTQTTFRVGDLVRVTSYDTDPVNDPYWDGTEGTVTALTSSEFGVCLNITSLPAHGNVTAVFSACFPARNLTLIPREPQVGDRVRIRADVSVTPKGTGHLTQGETGLYELHEFEVITESDEPSLPNDVRFRYRVLRSLTHGFDIEVTRQTLIGTTWVSNPLNNVFTEHHEGLGVDAQTRAETLVQIFTARELTPWEAPS